MQLLPLDTTNERTGSTRFRHSPVAGITFTALLASITVAIICWHIYGEFPLGMVVVSGGGCALMALFGLATVKPALKASNWILDINPQSLRIKFRSYLNAHFPEQDPQIAELDLRNITSANITKQTVSSPGSRNATTTSFHTFLDLHTAGADLQPLKAQIKYERTAKAPSTGRVIKSRSKFQHYPVSVVGAHTIRIEWRSPNGWITPSIQTALKTLSRQGIQIDPTEKERIDLSNAGDPQSAQDDKILQLAERGNILAAIKLTRRTYGMRTAEAKAFVEELIQ